MTRPATTGRKRCDFTRKRSGTTVAAVRWESRPNRGTETRRDSEYTIRILSSVALPVSPCCGGMLSVMVCPPSCTTTSSTPSSTVASSSGSGNTARRRSPASSSPKNFHVSRARGDRERLTGSEAWIKPHLFFAIDIHPQQPGSVQLSAPLIVLQGMLHGGNGVSTQGYRRKAIRPVGVRGGAAAGSGTKGWNLKLLVWSP